MLQAGVCEVLLPFQKHRLLVAIINCLSGSGSGDPVQDDESHATNHDDEATDQEDGRLMGESVSVQSSLNTTKTSPPCVSDE